MSFKKYLGVNYEHSTKEELVELCKAMTIAEELSGAEVDTLRKLWDEGPLEVGDVPSKQGVFDLIDRGLVSQWSNQKGDYYGVVTRMGGTVYRALNYLGNIQSLPILKSPATVDIQSNLTPYAKDVDQNTSRLNWVNINRQVATVVSLREAAVETIDGVHYTRDHLWSTDATVSISYLNILTVKDAHEFVQWLNGNFSNQATCGHIFAELGIWSIIYPGTINAQYRLTNVGLEFKNDMLALSAIVDRGPGNDPNARYGLAVPALDGWKLEHTLLQHLKTLNTLK